MVQLTQQAQVIEGLKLTRADLVGALKTERILQQNQAFIESQSELFVSNLATLTALQVSEQAGEQGQILDTALKIALDLRTQMRKLQKRAFHKAQEQESLRDPSLKRYPDSTTWSSVLGLFSPGGRR
ncbi:MAG: hypothetical protein ACUVRV_12290 [Cyanobacteriota bacterium]